jgi:hypothetical protein
VRGLKFSHKFRTLGGFKGDLYFFKKIINSKKSKLFYFKLEKYENVLIFLKKYNLSIGTLFESYLF